MIIVWAWFWMRADITFWAVCQLVLTSLFVFFSEKR